MPRYIAALCALAALVLALTPVPAGVPAEALRVAAVVTLALGLWATGSFPEHFTAFLFFLLSVVYAGLAPEVVFSGFHSGAVWLVLGGLVIGNAVQRTGLGARLARGMIGRFGGSYVGILAAVMGITATLAFFVPSAAARVVMLMPVVMALADGLGFAEGARGRVGMALAVGAGTLFPAFAILPGAVPNLSFAGAAESVYGVTFNYADYLLLHFPVLGIGALLSVPFILRGLYPDRPARPETVPEAGPVTAAERKLFAIVVLALGLWITDFIHGIAPAWVALGAAVLCLAPRIGVVPPETVVRDVNLGPWFYVAALIGMGAVVQQSGLGALIGRGVLSVLALTPGEDAHNFAGVLLIGMGMGLVATMPGQPGIMTPLADVLVQATGWPLKTVLMAQVPTWSLLLFPYQVPPMVVAIALARLRIGHAIRLLVAFTVFSWLVLVPLEFLWWRALGMFG